ncbi:MAG: xylulokinase [Acidimicrobiales bacterium]
MASEVTVGIDIGTTSVKAVAADGDGRVLARSRLARPLLARHAGELAHDARSSWRDGVIEALDHVLAARDPAGGSLDVRGVNVAAMVPSLCAVDDDGVPVSDGLLYGDARGAGGDPAADPASSGELVRFLEWLAREHPDAGGYWPAQAVANRALSGSGAIETTVAMTALPLFDFQGWDPAVAAKAGVDDIARLPKIVVGTGPVGRVHDAGDAPLGGGTIDALAEQFVAGADRDGDVLVILGSTLIVWAVVPEWRQAPGVWTVPHTAPGKSLIGGPSNAGGLFVGWADKMLAAGRTDTPVDPGRVPVWQPYLRGERVPLHDPGRRASLHDLDIGLDAAAVRRAAYEASAFAARHMLDLGGVATSARRIVATGGGVRDAAWVQALADGTGLPVDPVAVPEGAALGAAYLARVTAGLEESPGDAGRWARYGRRVDPDPRWAAAAGERYARYRELAT